MPPSFGWTQCPQNYCGQFFETDTANRNNQLTCINCRTSFNCEDSEGPPEPPEPEMLMNVAPETTARGKKKSGR